MLQDYKSGNCQENLGKTVLPPNVSAGTTMNRINCKYKIFCFFTAKTFRKTAC